jgi:hypothetical protein
VDQIVGCTFSHNLDPVHQSHGNSRHWRRLFSVLGLAMVVGLFVPSTAGAEARRRAYLPTPTGVTVVNLNSPVAVLPAYTSATPVVLAFTRDAQRMYGITQSGALLVYDLNGNSAPTEYALGLADPTNFVLTPDGTKAYVTRQVGPGAVVDLVDMAVDGTLPAEVDYVALSADGTQLYAATNGNLARYSTATDSLVEDIATDITPAGLAVSLDGQRAVVVGVHWTLGGRAAVVDLQSFELDDDAAVATPSYVAITPDATTALIVTGPGEITFLDLSTMGVQTAILAGRAFTSLDIEENGQRAWLYDANDSALVSVNIASHVATAEATTPAAPATGSFLGRPIFTGSNSVGSDGDLSVFGFGQEVLVSGTLHISDGFNTGRRFRFVGNPLLRVSAHPDFGELSNATLGGPLLGSGFRAATDVLGRLHLNGTGSLDGAIEVVMLPDSSPMTLRVDGALSSAIVVQSGGYLEGTGSIGDVTVKGGGQVEPNGGTLTVGNITFEWGSHLAIRVHGNTPGSYDRVAAASATIHPNATLNFSLGYTPSPGHAYTVLTNVTSGSSPFAGTSNGGIYDFNGYTSTLRYNGGTGDDLTLIVDDDLPTASTITNDTIDEDGVYNGSITVGDDLIPVDDLIVTATSSAPGLVPNANITISPTGATRTIQITPVPDAFGVATITVRVADANQYVERTFQLTVDNVNDAPTMTAIGPKTTAEDTPAPIAFNVADIDDALADVTIVATSSDQTIVPDANIVAGGAGAPRTLTITPAGNAHGTVTITVRAVDDDADHTQQTFQLTVNSVNDAPTMTAIGPKTTAEDTPAPPIAFNVADIDDALADVTIVATSSDQTIVPDANIVAGGAGAPRTLTITPAANAHGTVTITVRAMDDTGHTQQTFTLTVTPAADPPSISAIADQTLEQDASSAPLPFTITDVDGFDDHTVTASSSNPALVPNANVNLTLGGAAGARTLTITPAAGQHGTATITVTVDDGTTQASTSFTLTVNEPPPSITYALAEGATGMFFDTDLLLANPNAVAAPVTITWLLEGGGTIADARVLAPMSRATIKVDEITGLESTTFSTQVVSTEGQPIAVERTMRWGAGSYGAHTEKAIASNASTWYFAEGAAGWFSTYLLLGNPQATANTAHVEWLREGEPVVTRSYPLLPHSRKTIDTRDDADLIDRAFGAKVTFDQPGVAERTMYFGGAPLWSGGGAAAGETSLATRWDFAEGATGSYFTTFLLLANPGTTAAAVTFTYFPQDGAPVTIADTLGAGQRMTRNIALEDPSLANAAMAFRVESTQPIVAERAQYWGAPVWIESHNSFGVTAPGTRWALAEGRVGGEDEAQTYILLSNPGQTAGSATLTFLRTDGTTVAKTIDVPAASRITVGVTGPQGAAPELVNETFGTLIESTQPIIVERSLYSNANGIMWAAGTNATATRLPEPR